MNILFDTNIILDIYLNDRENNSLAVELFNTLVEHNCNALISASTLNTCFFLIEKHFTHSFVNNKRYLANKVAWQIIEQISNNFIIVGIDNTNDFIARKYQNIHDDYEDNLITASAERAKADYIVTEDKDFISHCPHAILNTQDCINIISQEFTEE